MLETWVWSLGQEEPHGRELGSPLQDSCLENPHGQRIVQRVKKSWTLLKWQHAYTHLYHIFKKVLKRITYFQWFFLLFKLMSNNWNYPRIYIFTRFYFIYLPNYPSILGFSLIFFVSMCVCVCVCVCVCDQLLSSVWLFATPWLACQAPLSMEFSRQEHWSELAFPTPGALPNPGIESASLASPALAGGFFPLCHLQSPSMCRGHIMTEVSES